MACTPHCPAPRLLLLGGSCQGGAQRSQWDARRPTLMERGETHREDPKVGGVGSVRRGPRPSVLHRIPRAQTSAWHTAVLAAQPCLTLRDPVDCSPPGSSVHGILQAGEGNDTQQMLGDFPGGPVVKNLSANTGNTGSIPGLGRSHMIQGD